MCADLVALQASAATAAPALNLLFLIAVVVAILLDDLLAVTLLGFALVMASKGSIYLSAWQLFAFAPVLVHLIRSAHTRLSFRSSACAQ